MSAFPSGIRRGFSLADLLVSLAILVVLVGLVVPAIQRALQAADVAKCQNNLKQLVIAVHGINDAYAALPPVSGPFVRPAPPLLASGPIPAAGADASLFWTILPFLEQDNIFQLPYTVPVPSMPSVTAARIRTFLCPSDPSGSASVLGTASYAGNALVFGTGAAPAGTAPAFAKIPDTFPDGLAFTILFAERYQNCTGVPNLWGANAAAFPPPKDRQRPAIGINPVITAGSPPPEPPTTFQVRPAYTVGAPGPEACIPGGAQTAHRAGMRVCMADGSVRTLGLGVLNLMAVADNPVQTGGPPPTTNNQTIFNALLTPAGGETIPAEF
jgi:hypothetical protein